MGWKEAQKRYQESDTLTPQRAEDLVARRVLRGMGFVARQLPDLERALGMPVEWDKALWPRTEAILGAMTQCRERMFAFKGTLTVPRLFDVDVREVDAHHKDILEMVPQFSVHVDPPLPLILTRIKNTQISQAYTVMLHDIGIPPWMKPPVQFIAEAGPWWVMAQETEHFISQFGPYKSPLPTEE